MKVKQAHFDHSPGGRLSYIGFTSETAKEAFCDWWIDEGEESYLKYLSKFEADEPPNIPKGSL